MTSSQRNKLAAAVVFFLIAAVVVGGMTWGTVSSFKLAKKNVTEDHERKISLAVWEMSSYMGGILNSEGARDPTDYVAFHWRRPVGVVSDGHTELDTSRVAVVLESPLAILGPPHNWIDLYFQVGTKGAMSSPQIHEDSSPWPFENARAFWRPDRGRLQTWQWVKTELPGVNLHERVAALCQSDYVTSVADTLTEQTRAATTAQQDRAAAGGTLPPVRDVYEQRQQILRDSQVSYLPPATCVDADIAERNVRSVVGAEPGGLDERAPQLAEDVEISADPITPFWLGAGPDGGRKLAFVRECHANVAVFYQGFIGDWDRLKPELLAQIANLNLFPRVDLEPVPVGSEGDVEASKRQMVNLPVRLKVPGIPGGAASAAWRSIRRNLITMWAAAAAVLVVAGWGLRSLVALTERRMQFAYAVTHELRTPLTTFRLYSDMLSAGLVPEASRQEYLDTLNRESLRLSSQVEGVLEYARLQSRRVKLNLSETDGASLLRAISETLEKRCGENDVQARTENAIAEGQRLRTDVDVVNRIAGVLVSNASRHARGTPNASMLVRLGSEDGALQLDVIDSGPGINRADARAIFRPFRRGRGADKAAQGGIGLGLALARSWASLLGGRLELLARHHPQYGGAHFRLTIPAQVRS
ncbi:MAG: HAMP domain-containing histidine kinase [Phycisphaerales bacterium]|nr:MAG: HAMP domain-containing histidine kinase [Phycisphaerales bacterium]